LLPPATENLQNFFGVFLQFHIGVDRYRRFETIDFFTKLLDGVEARECVQQSIRSTEEMCDEFENWEPEFDE